ncbi:hypothetical protein CYMTET_18290, partial [Cymbomonas tetramitiformis]
VVLVVPVDLGMSMGKVAAQCAHAAVGHYKGLVREQVDWLSIWESTGERTIVLAAENQAQLQALADQATTLVLPMYIVRDAGLTEVPPGTPTVLAIGGSNEEVDRVTGHLHTLRAERLQAQDANNLHPPCV